MVAVAIQYMDVAKPAVAASNHGVFGCCAAVGPVHHCCYYNQPDIHVIARRASYIVPL